MSDTGLPKNEQTPDPRVPHLIEKRYIPRWSANQRVLYQKENETVFQECRSRDIHSEGACICPSEDLSPHQNLNLKIYLSEDVVVRAQGKVLWVKNHASPKVAGLQFNNVSQNTQDMILEYAFNCNKAALIKHWFKGW